MNTKSQADLIPAMFISTAIAMIFTQLAGYGAVLIDGIITSRILGSQAYSGVSLLGPFNGIVLLLSSAVSVSAQVVSSQAIGRGNRDKATSAFTAALILDGIFAAMLVLMCIVWPSVILRVCGVTQTSHPSIYPHMLSYLRGYMYGIPFIMLIQVIGPIIVMDSGKALFSASAFVLFGADAAGDLLNAFVFHGGTFGMGIATTVSYILQALVLLPHFMKRNSYFRLSLKGFTVMHIPEMIEAALPTFTLKLATALRDLAVNRINIYVALTTAAIAARGMQNDINTVLFCFSMGMSKTLLTMTGMFYGAYDRRGLTRLFMSAVKMAFAVSGTIGLITFLCAEWIAMCFTDEPEVIEFAAFSIRCMSIALIPDNLAVLYQHYLQGINQRKIVNIINFASRFFIPVITAFILGMSFGSRGIMASIAASNFVLLAFIAAIVFVRTGSLRKFLLLPDDFGGDDDTNIYASITSEADVVHESQRAEEFCLEHGVSRRNAKLMALFVEETGVIILEHGKPKLWQDFSMDYRLSLNGGKLCITLRDRCGHFDPSAFYSEHKDDAMEEVSGMKIVLGLADDVRYFNAFNSNNIMIYLDSVKGAKQSERS